MKNSNSVNVKIETNLLSKSVGRRKCAIARIKLSKGTGSFVINKNKNLKSYFKNNIHQTIINSPIKILDLNIKTLDIYVSIKGGGLSGQADALCLGLARALESSDKKNYRKNLKKAGLLIRDSRVKERKKAGLKKARKAPQYSKR